jgi:very-short-patch-repair endonuclease
VIELDGDTHSNAVARRRDAARTEFFARQGFRVIRFFNREVGEDIELVLARIRGACGLEPPSED